MRTFFSEGTWEYGEKQVIEKGAAKRFTLTQPKTLLNEDYYTVRRAIAVDNCPIHVVPEEDFYVYEFSYMENGRCTVKIVDDVLAYKLLKSNLQVFMEGRALNVIKCFFDSMRGE